MIFPRSASSTSAASRSSKPTSICTKNTFPTIVCSSAATASAKPKRCPIFLSTRKPQCEDRVPVGYPLEGNEIAILDDDGNEPVAPGEMRRDRGSEPLSCGGLLAPTRTDAREVSCRSKGPGRAYLSHRRSRLSIGRWLSRSRRAKRFSNEDQRPSGRDDGGRDGACMKFQRSSRRRCHNRDDG